MRKNNSLILDRIIVALTFIGLIIIAACSGAKNNFKFVDSNNFVFIEYIQTTEGKEISGTAPKGQRIDGPTYQFNKEKKELNINRKPDFSFDTVKAVIGSGKVLKGAAGSGVSTYLKTINSLPFAVGKLTINKIDKKGVYITHDGKNVLIQNGEEWNDNITYTDTIKGVQQSIVEFKTTYSIRYGGLIDKKSVLY